MSQAEVNKSDLAILDDIVTGVYQPLFKARSMARVLAVYPAARIENMNAAADVENMSQSIDNELAKAFELLETLEEQLMFLKRGKGPAAEVVG